MNAKTGSLHVLQATLSPSLTATNPFRQKHSFLALLQTEFFTIRSQKFGGSLLQAPAKTKCSSLHDIKSGSEKTVIIKAMNDRWGNPDNMKTT